MTRRILILLLSLGISGCVPLIIGASAVGGYAVSKDTIQGDTDNDFASVWDAAMDVADIMGTIKVEDRTKGAIALTIDRNNVNIKIIELTKACTRLRVSCRTKYLLPNINLAQKVFVKTVQQLNRK